ncbi:GatB/YqeY domain-containing protein [Tuberibacillus calidus]|uniref:GatB/YqeY domain-containing protein n=1 Tax=Tuberibacillus calidus TaxID=340097 RepID=UPI0004258AD3|nr:GatB/YqeY domain-containing protein [Tuberibacillus calidus]
MGLLDQLTRDMKEAMKQKDKTRLSVIRMLKASLQNEAIHLNKELSEDEALTVLSRELKQRKDSLQEFKNAGREDLEEQVKGEIDIIQSYMPKPLSDEELEKLIDEAIAESGAKTKADMGKVMQRIMPKVKGKADGAKVNRLVQQRLS